RGMLLISLTMIMVLVSLVIYTTVSFLGQNIKFNVIRYNKHQALMAAQAGLMQAAYTGLNSGTYTSTEVQLLTNQWYKYDFIGGGSVLGASSYVYANASASSLSNGRARLNNWTITNTSTNTAYSISQIMVYWSPNSPARTLRSIYLNGLSSADWTGIAASGALITLPTPLTVPAGTTITNNQLRFSKNVSSNIIYATFYFTDGRMMTRRLYGAQTASLPDGAPGYPPNLQAWWRLNEGSGLTASDSIGTNTGTRANSPTWVTGLFSNALNFNPATGSYVNCGTAAALIPAQFSVSAWFKLNSLPGANIFYGVISKGDYDTGNGYEIYIRSSNTGTQPNKICWELGPTRSYSLAIPPIGDWTHVVGTFNGSLMNFYVNGTFNDSVAATLITNALPFRIGRRYSNVNNGETFDGIIDEVGFFNRALTAAEVLAIYNQRINATPTQIKVTGKFIDNGSNVAMRQTIVASLEVASGVFKIKRYDEVASHLTP
ncbi:MAG: LamG domain-containing protein, partial [bacterium]